MKRLIHRLWVIRHRALDRFLLPRPLELDPYASWLTGLGRDGDVKGRL